jgi:hypothetical protein
MVLRDWLVPPSDIATMPATVATSATPVPGTAATVATVATVAPLEAVGARRQAVATPEQEAELRALVQLILADAPHEHAEVLDLALRDPVGAVRCFRDIARGMPDGS